MCPEGGFGTSHPRSLLDCRMLVVVISDASGKGYLVKYILREK